MRDLQCESSRAIASKRLANTHRRTAGNGTSSHEADKRGSLERSGRANRG